MSRRSAPSEPAPLRRTLPPGSIAALLVLVAACLGTPEQGRSCACRPEPRGVSVTPVAADPATEKPTLAPPPEPEDPPPAAEVALPDFADPAWTRVPSRAGQYLVCWRAPSGQVPRNADFELEVWVLRDGMPVSGAALGVSAWMPDHGHGMLRQPRTEARADGSFRVEGMLLHMRGLWQLRFDVLEGALSETAECALEL